MRSSAGAGGRFGVTAVSLTVKLKTVVTMLAPGPNGVEPVAMVRSCTCAGPSAEPSMAVAQTIPFPFDVEERNLTEKKCARCQGIRLFATPVPAQYPPPPL